MKMMRLFYDVSIRFYNLALKLAAIFSKKARLWGEGRKNWPTRLKKELETIRGKKLIWMHCASLGEFEQGRPLIEWLKEKRPDCKILLTFFSPSGYEIRKNYALTDVVFYLPLDTAVNARRFLQIAEPELAIFVKYEFWFHYLRQLEERQISHVLISAIFRKEQIFFKTYGGFFRSMLAGFDRLFVQDEASKALLKGIQTKEVYVAGDTRIDRVLAIAKQNRRFPLLDAFAGRRPLLIVGSSWPPDEAILVPFINQYLPEDWKVIIAPHQIKESGIKALEDSLAAPSIRYSQAEAQDLTSRRVLIIDNIGMLSALYAYGRLAYIGGGFGAGIHNTLEPIAFGLPVIFGPKYKKFMEAVELVQKGGAFSIENQQELSLVFENLRQEEAYARARSAARSYVERNQGATERIGRFLEVLV